MTKLTDAQKAALAVLPPYNRTRNGLGYVKTPMTYSGLHIMPRTFNALVDKGLAWGVDSGIGKPYGGTLPAPPAA